MTWRARVGVKGLIPYAEVEYEKDKKVSRRFKGLKSKSEHQQSVGSKNDWVLKRLQEKPRPKGRPWA